MYWRNYILLFVVKETKYFGMLPVFLSGKCIKVFLSFFSVQLISVFGTSMKKETGDKRYFLHLKKLLP